MIVSSVVTVGLHGISEGRLNAEFPQVVALSGGVWMRLLGISIASFSSGPFNSASFLLWPKIIVA